MSWWRREKTDPDKSLAQAQKALELSHIAQEVADQQRETLEELVPSLQQKVSTLARINRENNFGPRLAAAYRGEYGK